VNAEAQDVEAPEPPATVRPPCDGCRHEQRCSTENLACEAFVIFKRVGTLRKRWAAAPRQPSAAIFERAHAPIKAKAPARCIGAPPSMMTSTKS
jgi:hypothetical protein